MGYNRYLAGVLGFEPRKCQIQSLVPYRLAIPQFMERYYSTCKVSFCQVEQRNFASAFVYEGKSTRLLP